MKDLDSPSGAIAETIARSHRILATDTWNGFRRTRFEFGGREASVVEPSAAAPDAASGKYVAKALWMASLARVRSSSPSMTPLQKRGFTMRPPAPTAL